MIVRVAVSKRRAKRLSAGVITHAEELGSWLLTLYSIADEQVAPFGMQQFETLEAALSEANDTLKVRGTDWVEIDEGDVEEFIKSNSKNRWYPSREMRPGDANS